MLLTIAFISFLVMLIAMVIAPSDTKERVPDTSKDMKDTVEGLLPAMHA